jgi:hypothetical protein
LHERYENYPSTHPKLDLNLWLKAGSIGGLDRNQVYSISNTTIMDIQAGCNVLIVGGLTIGIKPTISGHLGDCTKTSSSSNDPM